MIKKITLLSFMFIFLFFNVNSTVISNCQNITLSDSYILNKNVNISNEICFDIQIDNVELNCNNYNITGDFSFVSGIEINNKNNITIKNCNIFEFGPAILLSSTTNSSLENIYTNNNWFGITLRSNSNNNTLNNLFLNGSSGFSGLSVRDSPNNIFTNINLTENSEGIYLDNVSNSNFTNIYSSNNWKGIVLHESSNNTLNLITTTDNSGYGIIMQNSNDTLTNSKTINNGDYNLYFNGGSGSYSNKIYNNLLGNISKIGSFDWSYWNNTFSGNTFYNSSNYGSGETICFNVDNCDYIATIQVFPGTQSSQTNSNSNSVFPFQNITSLFLTLSILVGYIFFN